MAFRRLVLASICAALLQGASVQSMGAQELLQNGGFEQGTAGWSTAGANTAGCEAHSGSRALTLAGSGAAFAQQNLGGSVSGGTYKLSGWLKAETAATVNVALVWLDDSGSELARRARNVAASTSYASFSLEAEAPANAHGLRVRVARDAESNATICLDALSLDGPPLGAATPRPRPTATPQPTLTPTANAAAGERESDSRLASSQSATGPVASGGAFTNGGFEQGLTGWRNFGGDLRLVGAARSGTAAAELASNTDSTKWAYQTVRVNAAQSYEFAGYLRGGPGVSTARLRISWYASTDGSGEALSTSDSAALSGPTGDYVYLTTGAVSAPAAAQSARPRILLAPLGAGAASLLFDDLSFEAVAAPEPTQAPPAATSVPEAAAPRAAAPPAAPAAAASSQPTALPPTQTSEVAAVVAAAEPSPRPPSGPLPSVANRDEGVPLIWLAAAAAFVLTLGGSYLHARRAFDRRI